MKKRRQWLWITLFIGVALILSTLATGWNVVLVHDYRRMMELAKSISHPTGEALPRTQLISSLVLGTLGFFTVLGALILFFIRLLREMRLNQAQSEFLATVTHELKTPITAIELASSLLREDSHSHGASPRLSSEEKEKLWNSHQAELKRLRTDVESLLEAARWEALPVELESTKVNLETWLNESMGRWRSILGPEAQLTRSGESLDGPAMLDLQKLNLISDNILENSRKYANGNPRVIIRTSREKGHWQIHFQDFGWGFDPKEGKNLSRPFYRSKVGAPFAISGTGLGLYIASSASKALGMKMHGFSLGHGQGATFSLEGKELK